MSDSIHKKVANYYTQKINEHGATHWGVDWNSTESQFLRFLQLLKLHQDHDQSFTINDYGCGYGALVDFLENSGYTFQYVGYDLSSAMVESARTRYANKPNCTFTTQQNTLNPADYTVASGIFNVRLDHTSDEWQQYMLATMKQMWDISQKGIAFNCLTKYSDQEYMREYLHYTDPCFMFDYCKTHFSKQVALLHDYGLYEFTVLVRRENQEPSK